MNETQRAAMHHGHDAQDLVSIAIRALARVDDTTARSRFADAAVSIGRALGELGAAGVAADMRAAIEAMCDIATRLAEDRDDPEDVRAH